MKLATLQFLILFLFTTCTEYKIAPSTDEIGQKVAIVETHVNAAQTTNKVVKDNVTSAKSTISESQIKALSLSGSIDAAIKSLDLKNYPDVGSLLIKARYETQQLVTLQKQTQTYLDNAMSYADTTTEQIVEALKTIALTQTAKQELQEKLNKQTTDAKDDHEIAERCKSWFGVGAIFFGVEHLLKAGIVGILILVALVIAACATSGPIGIFTLGMVKKIFLK